MSSISLPAQIDVPAYLIPEGWLVSLEARAALAAEDAIRVASGWAVASRVRVVMRGREPVSITVPACRRWLDVVSGAGVSETKDRWVRLQKGPQPLRDFHWQRPAIMGVLNVTPDSFSDGGHFAQAVDAVDHAVNMKLDGADIIDIGGESTRPGASPVSPDQEWDRIRDAVSQVSDRVTVSVDTRNASTARHALAAGASIVNDVMAAREAGMVDVLRDAQSPVVLMHCQGTPQTMQNNPTYDHALLDVFDFLEHRIIDLEAAGVPRSMVMVDPGIGFGKSVTHNLTLIRSVGAFHALGCPIVFGVSRKSLIGKLTPADQPDSRLAGSLTFATEAVRQGCQILRVHDVYETRQALDVYEALNGSVD